MTMCTPRAFTCTGFFRERVTRRELSGGQCGKLDRGRSFLQANETGRLLLHRRGAARRKLPGRGRSWPPIERRLFRYAVTSRLFCHQEEVFSPTRDLLVVFLRPVKPVSSKQDAIRASKFKPNQSFLNC